MTDQEKTEQLAKALEPWVHAHCKGCDEYLCPVTPGQDEELRFQAATAILSLIKGWR